MMKAFYGLLVLFVLSSVAISAQTLPSNNSRLDVVESTVTIKMSQGQTKTATFHINNLGITPVTPEFITTGLDLVDNDGDRITVSFSDPGTIPMDESRNVTITARADRSIDFENYGGTVTVKDRNSSASDTFTLNIDVAPDVCDFGEVPDDLELEVDNPDNNEEVEPGELLDIKANVKNNGRNDRRIQVEAFLFAEAGREIASAASGAKNVEDGEDEDFRLEMEIPIKNDVIGDVDDEFTLFIKAFDDDNERLACIQKNVPIDIEIPSKKIAIDKANTRFFPSAVACGETAIANVRLLNLGERDNTVTLTLQNPELKILKKVQNIHIESFNAEERNVETRQFEVEIPGDAKKKEYVFALRADFEGGSATSDLRLDLVSCEDHAFIVPEQGGGILTVQNKNFKTVPGAFISIPVEIVNNLKRRATFTLSLRNANEFGVGGIKSVLLNAGQRTTLFMELNIRENVDPATYSAVLELASEEGIVASDTVTIAIEGEQQEEHGLSAALSSLPLGFWIVLNVVIVGLVLLSVRIITTWR